MLSSLVWLAAGGFIYDKMHAPSVKGRIVYSLFNHSGDIAMSTLFRQWAVKTCLLISVLASQAVLADMTVPTGTASLVRTSQTLNTGQISAGHRFTARLKADLVSSGNVVAPLPGPLLWAV